LYHSLWQDGLKKKETQPETDRIKQFIGIELPEADFEILKEEDKEKVKTKYEISKSEINELTKPFMRDAIHTVHPILKAFLIVSLPMSSSG
jgi:hypothetical protein